MFVADSVDSHAPTKPLLRLAIPAWRLPSSGASGKGSATQTSREEILDLFGSELRRPVAPERLPQQPTKARACDDWTRCDKIRQALYGPLVA